MTTSEVLPTYVNPCISSRQDSLESFWRYPSDFGECYPPSEHSLLYPRLIPVYNGKVLDLETEFVHASLSGISIKHYYGKCTKEPDDNDHVLYGDSTMEGFDYDWLEEHEETKVPSMSMNNITKGDPKFSGSWTLSSSGSFEYRESFCVEGQPLCTVPKINFRNSFWNIHRPELCKLTWGQKYVGTATVTEHLHEHLMQHGALCVDFHTEEARDFMLNRELDEYVRLKVVQECRKLPPDEPAFDFRAPPKVPKFLSRCKTQGVPEVVVAMNENERFLQLSDDEEDDTKIRRSKEEFCLTIGRHIRKPPMLQQEELGPEDYITPQLSCVGEEEVGQIFYFNWLLYTGDEYEEDLSENKLESVTDSLSSEPERLGQPCPPLMMDEFCRAAGKVDFSDLRCDPDF